MRVEDGFQPIPFTEGNPFTSDTVLPNLLKRILPESALGDIQADLVRFGTEISTTIRALGSRVHPPQLIQYDQWGRRVDQLQTSEGWRALKEVAQREGLPAIFYERTYGEYSRVYGFAKVLLMVGDSHEIYCPISMTDGCARVIELYGTETSKQEIFTRLISRDPAVAFTSGQWMTERPGGSDVSQTETVATSTEKSHPFGSEYKLNGFKWFSSATDSDVALALARTGSPNNGSRSLSLFLVPLRLPLLNNPPPSSPSPNSNGIYVHRLKNKIGTHALPTAELSLDSTEAYLIGAVDKGVKNITPMLNITRIYSAIGSLGGLRKCLSIASAFSHVRAIQGGKRLLKDTPLHVAQLASITLVYRSIAHLTFGVVRLLGKVECNVASPDEQRRLRILTPTVKAFAAEKACTAMEEAMASLGGAGYMEENHIGRVIRDCLVEKIWEGTTTVLSLDFVRAAQDHVTLNSFISWGQEVVHSCPAALETRIQPPLVIVRAALAELENIFSKPISNLMPRPALLLVAHIASSLYLLEHAVWSYTVAELEWPLDVEVFRRWVEEGGLTIAIEDVKRVKGPTNDRMVVDSAIVYGPVRARL